MKKIPGFFVTGFLESGKTSYIINNLENDDRCDKFHTLIVCCEQGEVEYTDEFLSSHNAVVRYIENFREFDDYKKLNSLISETKADRVFFEMNGMWPIKELLFPKNIELFQAIFFIDFNSFPTYFQNMRQTFVDNITACRIVVFINVDDPNKLIPYQTQLKLINKDANFFLMDKNMQVSQAFEDPLPYSLDQKEIMLSDEEYPIFYIDSYDHNDRYEGKIVEFDGQTFVTDQLPEGQFVIGRQIMNCCANDVQLFGLLAVNTIGAKITHKGWKHIKASISFKYNKEYDENELILTAIELGDCAPKEEVLNLSANR